MICIVSTFKTFAEAVEFHAVNSRFISSGDIYWVASIGGSSLDDHDRVVKSNLSSQNTAFACIQDQCYAEGWNNALELFNQRGWNKVTGMRVCFLGSGDKLLELPGKLTASDELAYIGSTIRSGAARFELPVRMLAFATMRAWTPSCLFPATLFDDYRFPTSARIASDVDLFFECFDRGIDFLLIKEFVVEMEVAGISSFVDQGAKEYCQIYEDRYGYSILARLALMLKRFKYHYIS